MTNMLRGKNAARCSVEIKKKCSNKYSADPVMNNCIEIRNYTYKIFINNILRLFLQNCYKFLHLR